MNNLKRAILVLAGVVLLLVVGLATAQRDRTIVSEIWIARPPADAWRVLAATDAYPRWNPMIRRISGRLAVGERIEVEIGSNGERMTFRPIVLDVRPDRLLLWKGVLLFPGLFDGEHRFEFSPENGGTLFRHSENFSGLLVGAFTSGLLDATEAGFAAMNAALKKIVECRDDIDAAAGAGRG